MSKKNKDIQIIEKEASISYQGIKCQGSEFYLGKKKIGTIVAYDQGFDVLKDQQKIMRTKQFDEAIEYLLSDWNLHQ